MPTTKTERLEIRLSDDVVRVRQLTRSFAVEVGLSLVDQTKIVTASSELARNTLDYGGGGEVTARTLSNKAAGAACGSRSRTRARASPTSSWP